MQTEADKIRAVLDRPEMYFLEMRLGYAIAFVSGLNLGFENTLLDSFQDWLVEEYFDEPQSFAWEVLVPKIPECSTHDDEANLEAFLSILGRYLEPLIHI